MTTVRKLYLGNKQLETLYIGGGILKEAYIGNVMVYGGDPRDYISFKFDIYFDNLTINKINIHTSNEIIVSSSSIYPGLRVSAYKLNASQLLDDCYFCMDPDNFMIENPSGYQTLDGFYSSIWNPNNDKIKSTGFYLDDSTYYSLKLEGEFTLDISGRYYETDIWLNYICIYDDKYASPIGKYVINKLMQIDNPDTGGNVSITFTIDKDENGNSIYVEPNTESQLLNEYYVVAHFSNERVDDSGYNNETPQLYFGIYFDDDFLHNSGINKAYIEIYFREEIFNIFDLDSDNNNYYRIDDYTGKITTWSDYSSEIQSSQLNNNTRYAKGNPIDLTKYIGKTWCLNMFYSDYGAIMIISNSDDDSNYYFTITEFRLIDNNTGNILCSIPYGKSCYKFQKKINFDKNLDIDDIIYDLEYPTITVNPKTNVTFQLVFDKYNSTPAYYTNYISVYIIWRQQFWNFIQNTGEYNIKITLNNNEVNQFTFYGYGSTDRNGVNTTIYKNGTYYIHSLSADSVIRSFYTKEISNITNIEITTNFENIPKITNVDGTSVMPFAGLRAYYIYSYNEFWPDISNSGSKNISSWNDFTSNNQTVILTSNPNNSTGIIKMINNSYLNLFIEIC